MERLSICYVTVDEYYTLVYDHDIDLYCVCYYLDWKLERKNVFLTMLDAELFYESAIA